jgi:hypothetical protein
MGRRVTAHVQVLTAALVCAMSPDTGEADAAFALGMVSGDGAGFVSS